MRFDIYGRYQLEAERDNSKWVVFRVSDNKRRLEPDIVIPSHIDEADITGYLEDLLHEYARPGESIRRL